ncbi:hypothetical protein C4546_01330 [Candidatus Parcubacteria bacterium]|nr:MAG: hypothetical protein C4546_01330 [Candidatus Parcubacteria bacterium]
MKVEDTIKNIISKSGNDLHIQVEEILKQGKWSVTSSPYYNDPVTGIPRETDIIARKDWDIHDDFGRNKRGMLRIRLFIECKFLSDPIVLWLKDKNIDKAKALAKDNPILRDKEDHYLTDTSKIPNKIHHYFENNQVINQWSNKDHKDPLFEAMSGCLNAFIYYHRAGLENHAETINYPIIIVNDLSKLYGRDRSQLGASVITDNQQLETSYSYREVNNQYKMQYFLIDVVGYNKFKDFLSKLENNDIDILRRILYWQLNPINQNND